MLAALNRMNYRRYAKAPAVTEYKEFPGRTHYTVVAGPGWGPSRTCHPARPTKSSPSSATRSATIRSCASRWARRRATTGAFAR